MSTTNQLDNTPNTQSSDNHANQITSFQQHSGEANATVNQQHSTFFQQGYLTEAAATSVAKHALEVYEKIRKQFDPNLPTKSRVIFLTPNDLLPFLIPKEVTTVDNENNTTRSTPSAEQIQEITTQFNNLCKNSTRRCIAIPTNNPEGMYKESAQTSAFDLAANADLIRSQIAPEILKSLKICSKSLNKKPSPIIVTSLTLRATFDLIRSNTNIIDFTMQLIRNRVIVRMLSTEDHSTVVSVLKANNILFYTQTPDEKTYPTFLIKGIDNSIPIETIIAAVKMLNGGSSVVDVKKFKTPRNGETKFYCVRLAPDSNTEQFLQNNSLLSSNITIEKLRKHYIEQCRRCLGFGHSTNNCKVKIRCAKCNGFHDPGKCPRSVLNQCLSVRRPPNYVNCLGTRTANYPCHPKYKSFKLGFTQSNTQLVMCRLQVVNPDRSDPGRDVIVNSQRFKDLVPNFNSLTHIQREMAMLRFLFQMAHSDDTSEFIPPPR